MLFEAFKASPFFGDASYYSKYDTEMGHGGHLYWMSRLALWGVFGFLGYLLILYKILLPFLIFLIKNLDSTTCYPLLL